jgi:YfiH family protein
MQANQRSDYLSLPGFACHPTVWHGFGTRELAEADLADIAAARGLRPVVLEQKHSKVIHTLTGHLERPLTGDGLVTARPGLLLVIRTADCLPVLAADVEAGVVAAAHCGWRGTCQRIVQKMVAAAEAMPGCRIDRLQVAMGPAIAGACYEVGADVRDHFSRLGLSVSHFSRPPLRTKKYHFDLRAANREQLEEAGVEAANIFSINSCTHCKKNLYSYRRDAQQAGRLLNFIGRVP